MSNYHVKQKGYQTITISDTLLPNGDVDHDKIVIPTILEETHPLHLNNVADMSTLDDYYWGKGEVDIKKTTTQPDINNIVNINYAKRAVDNKVPYTFGNPFSFTLRKDTANDRKQDQLRAFNDALDNDNYKEKLLSLGMDSAVHRIAHKLFYPATEKQRKQGIFFNSQVDLDYHDTYCIYSADIAKECVMGVNYYTREVYEQRVETGAYEAIRTETVYNVWTKWHHWVAVANGVTPPFEWAFERFFVKINDMNLELEAYPYRIDFDETGNLIPEERTVPLVPFLYRLDRRNAFEDAIPIKNAIDHLVSLSLDAVQQKTDYIIVLKNISADTEEEREAILSYLRQGILSIKSNSNSPTQADVDVLDTQLSLTEVNDVITFLKGELEEIINLPNRSGGGQGGSPTGSGIQYRDGFTSREDEAKLCSSSFEKSEGVCLDVILEMVQEFPECEYRELDPTDIGIKENRNKKENVQTAAEAYSMLRSAGVSRENAYKISELDPNYVEMAEADRAEEERDYEDETKRMIEREKALQKVKPANTANNTNNDSNDANANQSSQNSGSNTTVTEEDITVTEESD